MCTSYYFADALHCVRHLLVQVYTSTYGASAKALMRVCSAHFFGLTMVVVHSIATNHSPFHRQTAHSLPLRRDKCSLIVKNNF